MHEHQHWVFQHLGQAACEPSGVGAVNLKVSGASRGFAALMDDLLESLPKRTVLFMAETAVLEHLNASLCEAVTGAGDSSALLDKLEHSYRWWSHSIAKGAGCAITSCCGTICEDR